MSYEQPVNYPGVITLASAVLIGDSTIDTSVIAPSGPNFRILVEQEVMLVTGGTGTTTWNVTRGVDGTSAAAHANSLPITFGLTAGAVTQLLSDTSGIGTYASRPTATTGARAGMRYVCTDQPYEFIFDGSAWINYSLPAAWTNLAYDNSWTDYDAVNFQRGQYCKDAFGRVWLRGAIKPGVTTTPITMATLPVGFRPAAPRVLLYVGGISGGAGVVQQVSIYSNGTIILEGSPGTVAIVVLENISFSIL